MRRYKLCRYSEASVGYLFNIYDTKNEGLQQKSLICELINYRKDRYVANMSRATPIKPSNGTILVRDCISIPQLSLEIFLPYVQISYADTSTWRIGKAFFVT